MALNIITTPIEQNEHVVTISQQLISSVCESVIKTIINGLPIEAHTIETFNYVLDESKEMLCNKVIELK